MTDRMADVGADALRHLTSLPPFGPLSAARRPARTTSPCCTSYPLLRGRGGGGARSLRADSGNRLVTASPFARGANLNDD